MLERKIGKLRQWIPEMDIPNENKEAILKFDSIGEINKLAIGTRIYRLKNLRVFSHYVKKPFNEVVDSDIIGFFNDWRIPFNAKADEERRKPSGSLFMNMKITIRSFFQWLHKFPKGTYPDCVGWINISAWMYGISVAAFILLASHFGFKKRKYTRTYQIAYWLLAGVFSINFIRELILLYL